MPVVFTAANPAEAHLCQQYLEMNGLASRIDGEILWMSRGEFPLNEATCPRVIVSEENVSQALELVRQFQEEHLESGTQTTWTCPHCQERNPGSFEVCWNCQSAPDASESEIPQ